MSKSQAFEELFPELVRDIKSKVHPISKRCLDEGLITKDEYNRLGLQHFSTRSIDFSTRSIVLVVTTVAVVVGIVAIVIGKTPWQRDQSKISRESVEETITGMQLKLMLLLATYITCYCTGDTNRPTIPKLQRFQGLRKIINIPQEIGVEYKRFGVILLQDEKGNRVQAIELEKHWKPQAINEQILEDWVGGKGMPVRWDVLIQVPNDMQLTVLAQDIEEALVKH